MNIPADMVALRTLNELDDFSLASKLWINTLIPKHQAPVPSISRSF